MPGTFQPPAEMRACRIHSITDLGTCSEPLRLERVSVPDLESRHVLIRVLACGACRTELDEIEGRTPPPSLPVTPGHQVIGRVVASHPGCQLDLEGELVGVAWIYSSCGSCRFCSSGLENLCRGFHGCGRDVDGGYAEFMAVHEEFTHPLPSGLEPIAAAPLLCAGAVGLRAIRLCELENGLAAGLTGFGASGHLCLPMLKHLFPDSSVFVFARNPREREFALQLGADWAGDTTDQPPQPLSAVIDTTPAWKPVLAALATLEPGGRLVINAISKEAGDVDVLKSIDYTTHLWREKILRSVTNVTRENVRDCLRLATEIPLTPTVDTFPLEDANRALQEIRSGGGRGAKVLVVAD